MSQTAMDLVQQWLPKKLNHKLIFHKVNSVKPYQERSFNHKELEDSKVEGYITLSIFNANLNQKEDEIGHIYIMGCFQNAILIRKLLPEWKLLLYVDKASYLTYPRFYNRYFSLILKHCGEWTDIIMTELRTPMPPKNHDYLQKALKGKKVMKEVVNEHGWDLALFMKAFGAKGNIRLQYPKTIWRFIPAGYSVAFASRDADARLIAREAVALKAWMHTTHTIHRIFDNVGHANPFLAGLWGAKPSCRNAIEDYHKFGTCDNGAVPVPGMEKKLLSFLSHPADFLAGYGVDEKLMGQLDDELSKTNYTTVATYGQGSYYSGSAGLASLLEGRPRMKIGMPMMTLLPCKGPDDVQGTHQSIENFKKGKRGMVFGEGCAFVGEDLPLKGSVPKGVVDWIIDTSLNHEKVSYKDFRQDDLDRTFKKYNIPYNSKEFHKDSYKLSVFEFQEKYDFDRRILPHFWYTLLKGINGDVAFFEAHGSFNTNTYELSVFEKGMRTAFLENKRLWPKLLKDHGYNFYDEKVEDLAEWIVTDSNDKLIYKRTDYSPFYAVLRDEVYGHSELLKSLNFDQEMEYWVSILYMWPVTALQKWSFDF